MSSKDQDPVDVLGRALFPRKFRKLSAIANAVTELAKRGRAEPQADSESPDPASQQPAPSGRNGAAQDAGERPSGA